MTSLHLDLFAAMLYKNSYLKLPSCKFLNTQYFFVVLSFLLMVEKKEKYISHGHKLSIHYLKLSLDIVNSSVNHRALFILNPNS